MDRIIPTLLLAALSLSVVSACASEQAPKPDSGTVIPNVEKYHWKRLFSSGAMRVYRFIDTDEGTTCYVLVTRVEDMDLLETNLDCVPTRGAR